MQGTMDFRALLTKARDALHSHITSLGFIAVLVLISEEILMGTKSSIICAVLVVAAEYARRQATQFRGHEHWWPVAHLGDAFAALALFFVAGLDWWHILHSVQQGIGQKIGGTATAVLATGFAYRFGREDAEPPSVEGEDKARPLLNA